MSDDHRKGQGLCIHFIVVRVLLFSRNIETTFDLSE